MKLKTIRRKMLVTLAAACLLVPFLSLADFGPLNTGQPISVSIPTDSVQPTPVSTSYTYNEAYDYCFNAFFPNWTAQQYCMNMLCKYGCLEDPDDTGLVGQSTLLDPDSQRSIHSAEE